MQTWKRLATMLSVSLVLAVAVGACGSSSGSTSASPGSSSAASGGDPSPSAAAAIAPYVGKPSAFPVTAKLAKIPKGATVDYMDCGTPVCALFFTLLQPAAKAMGVTLDRVKAGQAANTVSAAFGTAVTQKPAAVITTAINVQLWADELKKLQAEKIPVITTGITGLASYNVQAPQAAEAQAMVWGKLMADYVAAKFGAKSNVVFYEIPELPFTLISEAAFKSELTKVCPGCAMRTSSIAAATIGNSAPSTVVSDLQANPNTTVAVFSSDEAETGVPAALQGAGIKVKTIGAVPTPVNLQYVKEGKETATLGYDLPVASWELIDQAAREIAGQKLSGPAAQGLGVVQFLTQKDITFNPAMGWTGYPDFAARFTKLWGVGG
jgi:ribose transport system substrate-binding protein